MNITNITADEFPGSRVGEMEMALSSLELSQGFSTSCTWKHYTVGKSQNICAGTNAFRRIARDKIDIKITTKCREGTLYVLRVIDK